MAAVDGQGMGGALECETPSPPLKTLAGHISGTSPVSLHQHTPPRSHRALERQTGVSTLSPRSACSFTNNDRGGPPGGSTRHQRGHGDEGAAHPTHRPRQIPCAAPPSTVSAPPAPPDLAACLVTPRAASPMTHHEEVVCAGVKSVGSCGGYGHLGATLKVPHLATQLPLPLLLAETTRRSSTACCSPTRKKYCPSYIRPQWYGVQRQREGGEGGRERRGHTMYILLCCRKVTVDCMPASKRAIQELTM